MNKVDRYCTFCGTYLGKTTREVNSCPPCAADEPIKKWSVQFNVAFEIKVSDPTEAGARKYARAFLIDECLNKLPRDHNYHINWSEARQVP